MTSLNERVNRWIEFSLLIFGSSPKQILLHPDDKKEAAALYPGSVVVSFHDQTNIPIKLLG